MTPEQTIAFIKILNHHEILSFSDENLVALDLESGAEVKIRDDGSQCWFRMGVGVITPPVWCGAKRSLFATPCVSP